MKTKSIITILVIFIAVAGMFFTACKKEDPTPEATRIEIVSGNGQTSEILATLINPVVVLVKNQNGDAFPGTSVSFTVSEGSVSEASVTTDANGNASVTWTLGKTSGTQTLHASVTGITGSPVEFNATGTGVIDFDGNMYKTVTIGTQTWMAENLKVMYYPNGNEIPDIYWIDRNTLYNCDWGTLADNNTADGWCIYDNSGSNSFYGRLYSYAAAIGDNWEKDNTDGQGVCPDDWHLPSDAEWTELINYLGGEYVAGGKLKETGTNHWMIPNKGATNESGFTALPSGYQDHLGDFYSISMSGTYWSATESNDTEVWCRSLSFDTDDVTRNNNYKSSGFSVRCILD